MAPLALILLDLCCLRRATPNVIFNTNCALVARLLAGWQTVGSEGTGQHPCVRVFGTTATPDTAALRLMVVAESRLYERDRAVAFPNLKSSTIAPAVRRAASPVSGFMGATDLVDDCGG
jgi:hypothetical protein